MVGSQFYYDHAVILMCLQGSIAYVKGLEKVQLVTKEEMNAIIKGLARVYFIQYHYR